MIQITMLGLGLIGTSIALALRSADATQSPLGALQITGYDANPEHVRAARDRLAIDKPAQSLAEALQDAQLVVLATPVQVIRELFTQIAALLPPGAVVTDVASTKAEVLHWAAELLPPHTQFIGGHPMAGRERSGPDAAEQALFQDAIYCLCPPAGASAEAIALVEALVKTIGAKPYYIDPEEHDAYVAGVSHLPFLLSIALVETVGRSPAWKEMAPIAATGFRDLSRLASGDALMHRDIALTNRQALIRWINDTIRVLIEMREHLQQAEQQALLELFLHARGLREDWLQSKPQQRPGEERQAGTNVPIERPALFGRLFQAREQPDQKKERGS